MSKTFPESQCNEACIEKQLDNHHNQCGINNKTSIKAVETGQTDLTAAEKAVTERTARIQKSRAPGTIV